MFIIEKKKYTTGCLKCIHWFENYVKHIKVKKIKDDHYFFYFYKNEPTYSFLYNSSNCVLYINNHVYEVFKDFDIKPAIIKHAIKHTFKQCGLSTEIDIVRKSLF